jgi:hypothetical protein
MESIFIVGPMYTQQHSRLFCNVFAFKGLAIRNMFHALGDHFCGLVVRVSGYITEMYCASCEVRTEFIYVM